MKKIDKEIYKAIKDSLPGQVSTTLQEVLAQAEKDAAAVELLNDKLERLQRENNILNSKKEAWEGAEQLQQQGEALNQKLNYREAEIKLRESHSESRVTDMMRMTGLVFGNPVYTDTAFNNSSRFNSNGTSDSNESGNTTTTKSVSKEK